MKESFFNQAVRRLAAAGVTSPRLETRLLLARAAGQQPETLDPGFEPDPACREAAETLLRRRLNHEPLDKILGCRDFYKYTFAVDGRVLSPRPDSEVLVEAALQLIDEHKLSSVLELGIGSGCLLLRLLADCPRLAGTGADKSTAALEVAAENARRLRVENRVRLVEFDYFNDYLEQRFDLIISNPPYIPSAEIAGLAPEVRNYDPLTALDGGIDGLDHYRQIARVAGGWLNRNGFLVLEVGIGQAEEVVAVFERAGWQGLKVLTDLGGIKRCVILKK